MSVASAILNYKLTFPQARSNDTEFKQEGQDGPGSLT